MQPRINVGGATKTLMKKQIDAYDIIQIHENSPRHVAKCDDCGKRRMTTQLTLKSKRTKQLLVEYLCNDCLTKVPDWT